MTSKIQQELDEHIKTLNEEYEHYKDHLINSYSEEENTQTVAELIRDADIDSIEFNIGFEQGYMRGLEMALSHQSDYDMICEENKNMAKALLKLNYTPDQISDICNGAI